MSRKWLSVACLVVAVVLLVGIVPVGAASVGAAPSQGDVVHIVQRGETLYSIARHYGVGMWDIARANGLTNPNRIYVGQRLVIPGTAPAGSTGGQVYIVRAGDTLYRIALRYKLDVWTIARANGITNLNRIYVGQRLVIPGTVPAPQPQPTSVPSQPVAYLGPWSGEYFDNRDLSGAAYVTRSDAAINFNWVDGPPAGGMPVNYFSARWRGTFRFDEGTYRLFAKVDDGVRVYVDGVLVINGWRDGSLRTYTADRALKGDHTIVVEYYDATGVAQAYFWTTKIAGPAPTPQPTATTAPQANVWTCQFFNNKTVDGAPVTTRQEGYIGWEWGLGSPASGVNSDNFSMRCVTKMALKSDHYRFCAMADDGVRIWVGSTLVLDEWHANNATAYCGVYYAQTGTYDVKVEYFEDGGKALIYVWQEPH